MDSKNKRYTKDELTVIWQPELCIHSTLCWKGLNDVFNPKIRPWINMTGAEINQIKEQVEKCPSGALSYTADNVFVSEDGSETDVSTSVEVMKNGPLMVYGNIVVKHSNGTEVKKTKVTAFCRCGASGNKPFCDGTHMKIGFKGE